MDPQEPQKKTLPGTEMVDPRETAPGNIEATKTVVLGATSPVTQRATALGTPRDATPGTPDRFSTSRTVKFFYQAYIIVLQSLLCRRHQRV